MFHGTLTIVTRIRASRVEALEALLAEVEGRIGAGQEHPFQGLEGLYFARWGILSPTLDGQRYLVFGADFSTESRWRRQSVKAFLHRWVSGLAERRLEAGAQAFEAIYRGCVGYPSRGLRKPTRVREFLRANAVAYTARHVDFAYRVETAEGMRQSLKLSEAVEHHLNTHQDRLERLIATGDGWEARIHEELRERLGPSEPALSDPDWKRRWNQARRAAARATLTYPPLRYLAALPTVGLLKGAQATSKGLKTLARRLGARGEEARVGTGELRRAREPQGPVQNPMIHIATLEPGWARWLALWVTLRSVNLRLARYTVGLNHIRSIHCARWVLLAHPRGKRRGLWQRKTRRLLFFSNYDGSWESYIDSFVDDDDVRRFLVEIWKGTEAFPRREPGRPFVAPFKAWIRQKQVPTRVWYSAHLHGAEGRVEPSIADLHHTLRLRRLLAQEAGAPEARAALGAFLSRGVFAPEGHVMTARESLTQFLARAERREHVRTRSIPDAGAVEGSPAAASVSSQARGKTRRVAPRGHPGAAAARVQAHGGHLLPALAD